MKKLSELDLAFLRKYENQFTVEMYLSYLDGRKSGKRKTRDEQKFEVDEMENLMRLCQRILLRAYKPSRGIAHVIHIPVLREIFAAPFIDRIVHHWIYDKIYEWWDKHFIYDSYSCREGKGTTMGVERLDKMIRRASGNYARPVWVVKMDIQGYFMSLNRKMLYDHVIWGLDIQYKDRKKTMEYKILKFLIRQIIFDDPVKGVKRRNWPEAWKNLPKNKSLMWQKKGFGIVIGNLTSQLFSNIFLDQLDRFVKFDLGYKYYGRYVDDFFIVVTEDQLKDLSKNVEAIRLYLKRMGLTLHPHKFYIQRVERGTAFLGGVVYPKHVSPSERVKKNFRKAMKEYAAGKRGADSIVSYMGHVTHMSHVGFNKKIYEEVGWAYREKYARKKQNLGVTKKK